ncbi:hypothetical protein ACT17_15165 [Mycolicibacterium conceptionense]|uniref:Uncharacterized protein n=1 Tax=Mycolicibacterium conceptionense TaxID=451644 RepID=A0A0J8UB70_9MYCO|nr:hypothetical protein [Mycolicibacterium conceptionense]KMV17620.1 hypothetical protein ACT17_15165 [Mycolicibacterium conceptionense]
MTDTEKKNPDHCPHVHLRGVTDADEYARVGQLGLQCLDCDRYLDGSPFWAGSPTGDHLWEHSLGRLDTAEEDSPALLWYCQPSVEFAWDQWARCTLRCAHGAFVGVALGVNFTDAFNEASAIYAAAPHPVPGEAT